MQAVNKEYHHTASAIKQEEELIKRAQKNPREFSVLYDKYYVQIFRYVIKRIGNEHDAADLTSQVFVKALQNIKKYKFKGVPFTAWLHRVASNELNLAFRAKKYDRNVEVKTEELNDIVEECETQPSEERAQLLVEALRQLSRDELELLEMRYFEKRPFKEVCQILDITESNAKVKMHRVIKKLKGIMLDEG